MPDKSLEWRRTSVFDPRMSKKTHKSSSKSWTVAETKVLVRGTDPFQSTHQPSKPVGRGDPPGGFDSRPPPLHPASPSER